MCLFLFSANHEKNENQDETIILESTPETLESAPTAPENDLTKTRDHTEEPRSEHQMINDENRMEIIDMTQDSSTSSNSLKNETPTQTPKEFSAGALIDQINSQLELLSEVFDTQTPSSVKKVSEDQSQGSCYTISSDSEEEICRKTTDFCNLEPVSEIPEEKNDLSDSEPELERTVIYFEQDKTFVEDVQDEKLVENLVDQTILDENSSDSMDFEEEVDREDPKDPKQTTNDSFDEFDALVYGEKKAPKSPIPSTSSLKTSLTPEKGSLARDFERLSNLERNLTKNPEYRVKVRDVTPPPNYEKMNDTSIEWEMKRFGLKFIRKREDRIKILNHIYVRTHPFIEIKQEQDEKFSLVVLSGNTEDEKMEIESKSLENLENGEKIVSLEEKYGLVTKNKGPSPKRKGATLSQPVKKVKKVSKVINSEKNKSSEATITLSDFRNGDESYPEVIQNDFYTSQLLNSEILPPILAVKPKGKLQWCPLPLHIAFVNVLRANSWLKLKVLQYEALEIEVLYKYFKSIGARYELSDLKLFLDKYCVTFRSEN